MERNEIYAVIDTNVLVSALLPSQKVSNPTMVLREVFRGRITPVYNEEILDEYKEVLSREKFHIHQARIDTVVNHIKNTGLELERTKSWEGVFPDPQRHRFLRSHFEQGRCLFGHRKHQAFPEKTFCSHPCRDGGYPWIVKDCS